MKQQNLWKSITMMYVGDNYDIVFNTGERQSELRERYNPEGSPTRKLQLKALEILKFIDAICRRERLAYFLSSGTLLGAVRHGGFIPWDDDLDIYMPRLDMEKLGRIIIEANDSKFFFQSHSTDSGYYHPIAKVVDKTTECIFLNGNDFSRNFKYRGVWVDIFPIEKLHVTLQRISFYTYNYGYRFHRNKSNSVMKFLTKMRYYANVFVVFPALRAINIMLRNEKYNKSLGNPYFHPLEADWIFPLREIEFEGFNFFAPNNCDAILKELIGPDYALLPRPCDRITHWVKMIEK